MIIVNRKMGKGKRILEVGGSLTVSGVGELKIALQESLETGDPLELIFSEVEDVDLSFIQVVAAARDGDRGNVLTVGAPVPEIVRESIRVAGLHNHDNCTKPDCLWCSMDQAAKGKGT